MGTIAVVLSSMSRKSTKHQEQIERAGQTMKNIQLSVNIQHKVQDYLTLRQNDIDNQKELDNLLSLLSPSLRLMITQHVFLNAIGKMPVFIKTPEIVEYIVTNIDTMQFKPEDYIFKQG